ncbi:MAG: T9SS type A sorting domain-containing protein, partial [Ignavibacteriaceae bacterium]|nr:T9SS type A sorting domain-containing protein [Ignavibacteriaceae bacterium]
EAFTVGVGQTGVAYGDFNNDGKCDIVINSLDVLPELSIGAIYIYMGNEIPPDTATFIIKGSRAPSMPYNYGYYFQIGNINYDNYDDLILSFRVRTIPPNPQDSLDVFHFYLGNDNFSFYEGGQTFSYESKLKNTDYSYGWVKRQFSVLDLNGSNISDLMINHFNKDSTNHVHFGSTNEIDTIPSFYITDPDTTRPDVIVGQLAHNIGDFNNDGYDDFILKVAYYKSFSLHLGGPRLSNNNPYGMRGLLEANSVFPYKALNCDDQNGDGVKDFVATARGGPSTMGYVLIFLGDPTIVTNVDIPVREKSVSFSLLQNYPNPFNPFTTIRYAIAGRQNVTMKVYDILGKEVVTLLNEEKDAGYYQIEFDPAKYNLASGVYFCELRLNNNISNKIKMIYLK